MKNLEFSELLSNVVTIADEEDAQLRAQACASWPPMAPKATKTAWAIYSGVAWAFPFVSTALAASSVRSMWGSERRPPAFKTQSLPASTPHVGQGTASNSCGVRSVIFTDQAYGDPSRKTIQFVTLLATVFRWSVYNFPFFLQPPR